MEAVSVAALVEAIRGRAASGPLERVEAALAVGDQLTSGADELIGYFVEEARSDGRSWTEIGQRLGVSKQAARQRFAVTAPLDDFDGARIQPRLRACLDAAGRDAAQDGATEIGTHHQLIGLFHEGLAAAILEKLGLSGESVGAAARELFAGGQSRGHDTPPNSLESREALRRAAGLARNAGLDSIGTEHLLAALAFDPGSRARRVLSRLGFNFAALKKELACYGEGDRGRRRRRGKFTSVLDCSFCGKRGGHDLRTVAGPGVLICEECVRLCLEILSQPLET